MHSVWPAIYPLETISFVMSRKHATQIRAVQLHIIEPDQRAPWDAVGSSDSCTCVSQSGSVSSACKAFFGHKIGVKRCRTALRENRENRDEANGRYNDHGCYWTLLFPR